MAGIKTMKAAVLHGINDIRYEDVPKPTPSEDEVLVRVRSCGICGSDVPRVLGDAAYFFPIILGHEFAGDVVETGARASNVAVGDTVAGAALLPCFSCEDCARGNYGSCKNYRFAGSWVNGAFCEYIALPARNVVRYAPNVSYDEASLFEPCTVALHGIRRAGFAGGGTVAVVGSGTIGAFLTQWARLFGASQIIALDSNRERLAAAARFGADDGIDAGSPDWREKALALTNGRGFDYVFDTAGQPETVGMCFELAAVRGTICYIGFPNAPIQMDHNVFHLINRKELSILGSQMSYSSPFPGEDWTMSAHFISKGAIRCDASMIDRRYPMAQAAQAFERFRTPGGVKGKIILYNE